MKVTITSIAVSKYYVFKDVAIFQLDVEFAEIDGYVLFSRFSKFEKFHKQFIEELSKQDRTLVSYIPPIPPKRLNNTKNGVLQERKHLITNFFSKILRFKLNERILSLRNYIDNITGPNAKISFFMTHFLDMQKVNKRISHKIDNGFIIREGNITGISVRGYFIKEGNTFYRIITSCHNLPGPYNTWEVDVRYTTILKFHVKIKHFLKVNYPNLLLALPHFPQKELVFSAEQRKTVINRRVCLFNNYFQVLLLIKEIRNSKVFEDYCGL